MGLIRWQPAENPVQPISQLVANDWSCHGAAAIKHHNADTGQNMYTVLQWSLNRHHMCDSRHCASLVYRLSGRNWRTALTIIIRK